MSLISVTATLGGRQVVYHLSAAGRTEKARICGSGGSSDVTACGTCTTPIRRNDVRVYCPGRMVGRSLCLSCAVAAGLLVEGNNDVRITPTVTVPPGRRIRWGRPCWHCGADAIAIVFDFSHGHLQLGDASCLLCSRVQAHIRTLPPAPTVSPLSCAETPVGRPPNAFKTVYAGKFR